MYERGPKNPRQISVVSRSYLVKLLLEELNPKNIVRIKFLFKRDQTKGRTFMENEIEQFFQCPYCGSQISMLIEIQAGGQEYIEDCEVCCRPIRITYEVQDGVLTRFVCHRLDD